MGVTARYAALAVILTAQVASGEPIDIGAAIRNSERDFRELAGCAAGAPITYDATRRVLTCATSAGVVSQCVALPSIAAGALSATPIAVTWPTPFPVGGYRVINCSVDAAESVGVTVWRPIPPTAGATLEVDVFNRDAATAHDGRLCCYAQSQSTPTPTPTHTPTATPT